MILKGIKYAAIGLGATLLLGGIMFGPDVFSYFKSGHNQFRKTVKESVPVEFELERARDLVQEIVPELQANIKLIAQEEVEINALNRDIHMSEQQIDDNKKRVSKLRDELTLERASYNFGNQDFSRQQVKEDLVRRFDNLKETEVLLEGKRRLLETRKKSLAAANKMMDKSKVQKARLDQQIESLTAQYRLVQAATRGSRISVDDSKLAKSQQLITEIKKRMDVAERVLAHESKFVEEIEVDVIDEKDLFAEVDTYLNSPAATSPASGLTEPGDELILDRKRNDVQARAIHP